MTSRSWLAGQNTLSGDVFLELSRSPKTVVTTDELLRRRPLTRAIWRKAAAVQFDVTNVA